MHPIYYYYYKRKMINPPHEDTPYINKMIKESVRVEHDLILTYENMVKNINNKEKDRIYKSLIMESTTHIKILETIYGNINNKHYDEDVVDKKPLTSLNDIILKNVELSKVNRKILFGLKNTVHRLMMYDIIVDNTNTVGLMNMISHD